MHQIRAHLNHIGHPLDGDGRYDRTNAATPPLLFYSCVPQVCPSQPGRGSIECDRLFLHAASLCTSFATMDAGDAALYSVWCVRAVAELPLLLKQRLEALGWNAADSVDAAVAAAMGPA